MPITLTLTPTNDITTGTAPNIIQQTFVLTTDTKCDIDAISISGSDITIEDGYESGGANVPFTLDVAPDSRNIILNVNTTNFGNEPIQSEITITNGTVSNTFDFAGRVTKSFAVDFAKKLMSQDRV